MPKPDPKLMKSLEAKLSRLIRCVITKAGNDPDFAQELGIVLEVGGSEVTPAAKSTPAKRKQFSPVTFLHENGEERLRLELGYKTDSELRDIIRGEGIAKGKEVSALDRDKMINDIVAHADRRLHQGSVFLTPSIQTPP